MNEHFSLDESKSRLERFQVIKKTLNPYHNVVHRTHLCREADEKFEELQDCAISLAGRIMILRKHGGSIFGQIRDSSGSMQIFFRKDTMGQDDFHLISHLLDRGDFLQVNGNLFLTKTKAKTLLVKTFHFLSKAFLPLPEKWHGMKDIEQRYRQRYIDLLSNDRSRQNLIVRAALIQNIRAFLDQNGFIEVETPILQPIAGGATARPFVTHHNELKQDMFLRIAPELYLKRLIVGGFERVYEIAKCFRNEGIDQNHNPEFTQVEFYYAYQNYEGLMDFTERLLSSIIQNTIHAMQVKYKNFDIDFSPPYERMTFRDAIKKYSNIDIESYSSEQELIHAVQALHLDVPKPIHKAKIFDALLKKFVRPKCVQPVFITDHPTELSPLARKKDSNPRYVERFQLLVGGEIELCNAFSELNDPFDQEQRFLDQEEIRSSGDDEAQSYDADFVEALKYGMPPTAGLGMGIDRLAAILTGSDNLKEIIAFPTLRSSK